MNSFERFLKMKTAVVRMEAIKTKKIVLEAELESLKWIKDTIPSTFALAEEAISKLQEMLEIEEAELQKLGKDPEVTAPRSSDVVTAPRSSDVTAPRSSDVTAPRSSDVTAPRSSDVTAPRSSDVTAPGSKAPPMRWHKELIIAFDDAVSKAGGYNKTTGIEIWEQMKLKHPSLTSSQVSGRFKREKTKGDKAATVEKGDNVATVEKGDKVATVEKGDKVATVEAGEKVATVEAGDKVAAEEAGDKVAAEEAGEKAPGEEAGEKAAAEEEANA